MESKMTAYVNYDAIWEICGGSRHGPNVEHVSMEHANFPRFCKALIEAATRHRPSPDSAVRGALERSVKVFDALDGVIPDREFDHFERYAVEFSGAAITEFRKLLKDAHKTLSAPSRKDGEADGETAAIIAWLRNPAGKGTEDWADAAEHFAWCIENGQHRAVLSNAGADA